MSGQQRLLRAIGIYRDKDKDPAKWNEQWEKWLSKEFAPRDTYRAPGFDATAITTQSTLSKIQDHRSHLIHMQAILARLIEEFPINETWLSLPPTIRQDHLLKAIVAVCTGPGAELNRTFCPELTISFLERDGGKGFLQLLLTSCPPSGVNVVEPILVGHPVFDAIYNASDGHVCPRRTMEEWRIAVAMAKYERNMFLCTFLLNVCTIVKGLGLPKPPKIHKGLTSLKGRIAEMKESPLPEVYTGGLKEVHKQGVRICANCRKKEEELPNGRRFMQCIKCRDHQNRKVVYCDRECQVNDWKNGNPPHKTICGKPFTLPWQPESTPLKSAEEISIDYIPQPSSEWSRPTALEEQISLLRSDSSLSYVLMQPTGNQHHGIALTDAPQVAQAFINFRNRAFYNGDIQSVALMSKVLCFVAKDFGLLKEDVFQQLSKEYGATQSRIEAELDNLEKNILPQLETLMEG
ncbi:hypothetical protein FRC00_007453, partial [Tulasnella sp. 408]